MALISVSHRIQQTFGHQLAPLSTEQNIVVQRWHNLLRLDTLVILEKRIRPGKQVYNILQSIVRLGVGRWTKWCFRNVSAPRTRTDY